MEVEEDKGTSVPEQKKIDFKIFYKQEEVEKMFSKTFVKNNSSFKLEINRSHVFNYEAIVDIDPSELIANIELTYEKMEYVFRDQDDIGFIYVLEDYMEKFARL